MACSMACPAMLFCMTCGAEPAQTVEVPLQGYTDCASTQIGGPASMSASSNSVMSTGNVSKIGLCCDKHCRASNAVPELYIHISAMSISHERVNLPQLF